MAETFVVLGGFRRRKIDYNKNLIHCGALLPSAKYRDF